MNYPIIDLHCDVLSRFESKKLNFLDSVELDANLENLRIGHVKVQAFAIFISPNIPKQEKIKSALRQIYYFNEYVIRPENNVIHIKKWSQIEQLKENEIGAFITIEGVDFFEGDIKKWHLFKDFGVLNIGLTWNFSNEAADGVGEDLARGVTSFGREIIQLNNAHKIFTDVSHLSERSFWDVIEHANHVIATHSNAKALCDHRRNLSDAQIQAMIRKNAPIHIVYNPPFIKQNGVVNIKDLLHHVEHICSLGGKELVGLGSDFDGISEKVCGLETAAQQQNLINEMLKLYPEEDVKGFAYQNFLNHCPK
ncbi:diguanylate cyclase [Solibacillus sp. R5-41]|uniref:dipeptidase n=1 Tax=Solibacillus sp. R5-41 TaxID=2048654 RepID=UPI000C1249AB|nr:dipeptidase [Solibacillus sp. R5-41]ATP41520.1 diguanylate cyclase [Solibacillus sp. R5-41]